MPIYLKKQFIIAVYILLALITAFKQYHKGSYNNYKIYKYTFINAVEQKPLYANYPANYDDSNHYGPIFSFVIAPFAILPDGLGCILWNIFNALLFLYGIYSLPFNSKYKGIISLLCFHEALVALISFQFNVGLTGLILISFSAIIKQKEIKSALAIVLGTLIKLYGIVGLAFFFFSKNKIRWILAGICFFVLLTFLPSILNNFSFTASSYKEWYSSLVVKNQLNASLNSYQDISLMGIFRRTLHNAAIPNLPFLITGLIIYSLPFLRISKYDNINYRLLLLASTLIFVVIFSSGSESPTYIIAFTGVVIWFMVQNRPYSKFIWALFIFAFILTTMSPSDLFPKILRDTYVRPYALKALPCALIWITIIYQMLFSELKINKLNYE